MSNKDNLGNVLIRSDLNVPVVNGKISDDYRIYKSLENINNILERSKTITFASHMGRPMGKDLNLSLKPVAEIMTEIIGIKVHFINEIYGDEVKDQFREKFINKDKDNINFFTIRKSKIYFDLLNYVKKQVKLNLIKNIDLLNIDTFNIKNNFFSARRSLKSKHADYGRNISIIMIN